MLMKVSQTTVMLAIYTLLCLPILMRPAFAQGKTGDATGVTGSGQTTVTTTATKTSIQADNGAYHLEWNGTTGQFVRHALGTQPEVRFQLHYLHTEPGPKGYAKYLTWFVARDNQRFNIVWCYLNDTGKEFYCWLYQYPQNQITPLRFVGNYQFLPSPEPVTPTDLGEMKFSFQPRYNGPDFVYKNWNRKQGTLESLPIQPTQVEKFAAPLDDTLPDVSDTARSTASTTFKATTSISNLKVFPLHQLQVAQSNGWRKGGWRELHALGVDGANNPWYLILYSNSTRGYAIDLRRLQGYVADFGETVKFANNDAVFGTKDDVVAGPPDVRVRRFSRIEIPLVRRATSGNPYTSVRAEVELRRPDGRLLRVSCFWDGGQTWRLRFAPTQVGRWSWKSYSIDPDLADQTGTFTCIADDTGNKGFISTDKGSGYKHGFVYGNGAVFFPVWLQEPTFYLPAKNGVASTLTPTSGPRLVGMQESQPTAGARVAADAKEPKTFTDFKARVDAAVKLGYNRFWGAYVLDPNQWSSKTQANEGGAPFVNYDLDQINPAYFQWMDRRIAYCNEHGVVPEISVTDINAAFLSNVEPAQITRLWAYILARYASFNVTWNLFHVSGDKPYPANLDSLVESLAPLTARNDPYSHPLTTTVVNSSTLLNSGTKSGGNGPVIFTPSKPASVIPVLPGAQAPATSPPGTSNDPRDRFNRNRFSRRTRPTPNSDQAALPTVDSSSYIVNVDPNAASEVHSNRPRGSKSDTPPVVADIRYSDSPWFNVVTLAGGSPSTLQYDYSLNMPVVLLDNAATVTDETRHRMWETIMRGAFWVPAGAGGESGAQKLDDPVSQWQIAAARLLQQTLFSRLRPNQDTMGGPQETPFDRRRRAAAEASAAKEAQGGSSDTKPAPNSVPPANTVDVKPTGADTKPSTGDKKPAGPIYVLADTGWEYLVYFQAGGSATLDLLEAIGPMKVQWFNPRTGIVTNISRIDGGQFKTFIAPDGNDWVLYLTRREK